MNKRKFIKSILSTLTLLFLLPKSRLAKVEKKIINNSLTEEQKKIMFKEGTERPFTSSLNYETT